MEDTAFVELDGYLTFSPQFSGSIATYEPAVKGGIITITCCEGIRGNVNGDLFDEVNVADLTFLVDYLFRGGMAPPCPEEGDINGNSDINIVDLTYLVDYLFKSGLPPADCL